MATFTFRDYSKHSLPFSGNSAFDREAVLKNHAWYPDILDPCQAELILSGTQSYTYLLRPNLLERCFSISFVQKNGQVKHDNFRLIDPIYGLWRNGHFSHIGKLEKVICDMMECSLADLRPHS